MPFPETDTNPPRQTVTLRVLVVDDDDGVHVQLRKLFKTKPPLDVETFGAKNISEAYAAIPSFKPDVILLDLNLTPSLASPVVDQWPAERTMHEIHALDEAAGAPVIAFSGGMNPDEMWPLSVKFYGAYWFFSKQKLFAPSEFKTPLFRGCLMDHMTNAIFLHSRLKRERSSHGPQT